MARKKAAAEVEETEGMETEEAEESGVVDLSGEEEPSFELIPRSKQKVIFDDVEPAISQNSGSKMWSCKLKVTEGEFEGRTLYTHIVFNKKSAPFARRTFKRLGLDELADQPFDYEDEDKIDLLRGVEAVVKVNKRKYEGEFRNNVQEVVGLAEEGNAFLDG